MPNEWSARTDVLDVLLIPILQNIGIIFPENPFQRILYITQFEASLYYLQLQPSEKQALPKFVQNENHCLLYSIEINNKTTQQQSMYFQFKESYDLKLYNGGRFYMPKVKFMEEFLSEDCMIDFSSIKNGLHQLVFAQILDVGELFDAPLPYGDYEEGYESLADIIIYELLQAVNVWLEYPDDFESEFDGPTPFLQLHLNESQEELLFYSEETIKNVIQHLEQQLSNQIQRVADYITRQNRKVPYFKKSIILNGCISDDISWFKGEISSLFFTLLYDELKDRYQNEDPTKFYLITNSLFYQHSIRGACLYASMKLMNLNIMLSPVVVKKSKTLNTIGLPLHIPVEEPEKVNSAPDIIVFIDISLDVTSVTCEIVSKQGLTQQTFNINIQNKNKELASIVLFLAYQYSNSKNFSLIKKGDVLNFSEFRELKAAKLMHTANEPTRLLFEGILKKILTKINKRESMVDRMLEIKDLQLYVTKYLAELVRFIDTQLNYHGAKCENKGYVLSIDKLITNNLLMESKIDLSKFIKENMPLIFANNAGSMVVVDQGEKEVHDMLQSSHLVPPSFYVHANIEDTYIFLKLQQVVDITRANDGKAHQSTVFIKDKKILMTSIREQVCQQLWSHIHSLHEKEREDFVDFDSNSSKDNFDDFESFKEALIFFIKEKLHYGSSEDLERKHKIRLPSGVAIIISIHQLLHIAIIPVLQQLFSTIVSTLTNTDIFGYYEIAKLFATGRFFELNDYCEHYHYTVMAEIRKICKQLIRNNTYRTKLDICLSTSRSSNSNLVTTPINKKCFCYDMFLNGELRIVSSSTYFVHLSEGLTHEYASYGVIDSAIKCGYSYSILLRGEELHGKTIQVKASPNVLYDRFTKHVIAGFFKYDEPQSMSDVENFSGLSTHTYGLPFFFTPKALEGIKIDILHYSSSIKITSERFVKMRGVMQIKLYEHILGERFTLKYF